MKINFYFVLYALSVVVASFSQILLKKSAMKTYPDIIREYVNPLVIGGYFMLFASMIMTILAYSGIEYKNGPIIESAGYVLVMFLSLFFFGEKITRKKAIGTVCILFGIFIFYL